MSYIDPRVKNLINIPDYDPEDIIRKVKSLNSFTMIPPKYWILGVQSKEDQFNRFDDVFYLFFKETFILRTSGTTNAGATGLKRYHSYGQRGTAVIKTNQWYYNLWKPGLHKNKMEALKQAEKILHFRDSNKDINVEERGDLYYGLIGINFHSVTYSKDIGFWRRIISSWSVGCQVANVYKDYRKILDKTENQRRTSYCLIKEW